VPNHSDSDELVMRVVMTVTYRIHMGVVTASWSSSEKNTVNTGQR